MPEDQRLAAIMFTDIVGNTAQRALVQEMIDSGEIDFSRRDAFGMISDLAIATPSP